MRVLLHTPFFHPLVGGVETFTDGLAGELARRGYDVRVFAETPLEGRSELSRSYYILRAEAVDREAALVNTDVLIAIGPGTRMLPAARRRRVPFILIHQNPAADCPIGIGWQNERTCSFDLLKCLRCRVSKQSTKQNVIALGRRVVLRWAMRVAAANVYISEYIARRAGIAGTVIGNFYDPTTFYPSPAILPEPHFLFVGRLVPIKGAEVALRGFALARRRGLTFNLRVIGEGPELEQLRSVAEAEGVDKAVAFAPFTRGQELADEYRRAWAVLFPSQWEEPFGIVQAEAMGCGTPVIASHHGACPEVVGKGGIFVPAAVIERWADAMTELAADENRRSHLSNQAVTRAQSLFALQAIGDAYHRILDTLTPVISRSMSP